MDTIFGKIDEGSFDDINKSLLQNIKKDTNRLVSEYTFRKLIQKDFRLLINATDDATAVGRYASLKVDSDKSTFAFTPFAKVHGSDPLNKAFRGIYSIDLGGSVNSSGQFRSPEIKKIKVGGSATLIFIKKTKYFFSKRPFFSRYDLLYTATKEKFLKKKMSKVITILDTLETENLKELKVEYMNEIAKNENLLIKGKWNAKQLMWLKFDGQLISFDNFQYSPTDSLKTSLPIEKTIYTPSVSASLNYYRGWEKKQKWFGCSSIYFRGGVGLSRKHVFSEVETKEWNQFSTLNDTTVLISDTKKIYIGADTAEVATRFLPDFNAQLISFLRFGEVNLGLDLSYSGKFLVESSDPDENGFVNIIQYGIIIPFRNNKGKSTINIEPFYEHKIFTNSNEEDENTFGVKFSIPFTRLFN